MAAHSPLEGLGREADRPVSDDAEESPVGEATGRRTFLTKGTPRRRHRFVLRYATAGTLGAIMGVIVSMIVNVSLVEVSLSPFFAVYFAMLFVMVGSLIVWRTAAGRSPDPDESHPRYLYIFAALVIIAGFLSLALIRRDWFLKTPRIIKLPIYTLLGVATAFALTFTVIDVVNSLLGILRARAAKPLVQSLAQVRLIVVMALLMGGTFGMLFGLMHVEDEMTYRIRLALIREERTCVPIGIVLGATTGILNEYLGFKKRIRLESLVYAEFDDDI